MYFTNQTFATLQELKNSFRKLAIQLHPDKGGNEEDFKAMVNEYEKTLKSFVSGNYSFDKAEKEINLDAEMREVLENIFGLDNITIEIVGSWLWITGNTFPVKDTIKGAGFKFASKKKAWFWHSGDFKKKSRSEFNLSEIKNLYGSQTVKNDTKKALK